MAISAPQQEHPNSSSPAKQRAWQSVRSRLRQPRTLLAGVLLVAIATGSGVLAGHLANSEPAAHLGAAAEVPGGLARVNGVIPLESDGWLPVDAPAVLTEPVAPGSHLVRIELQLTAIDADGLAFSAEDYTILGLGSERLDPIWASPEEAEARQGSAIGATLVYEIPNRAVALTLERAHGGRLALGVDHHVPER